MTLFACWTDKVASCWSYLTWQPSYLIFPMPCQPQDKERFMEQNKPAFVLISFFRFGARLIGSFLSYFNRLCVSVSRLCHCGLNIDFRLVFAHPLPFLRVSESPLRSLPVWINMPPAPIKEPKASVTLEPCLLLLPCCSSSRVFSVHPRKKQLNKHWAGFFFYSE